MKAYSYEKETKCYLGPIICSINPREPEKIFASCKMLHSLNHLLAQKKAFLVFVSVTTSSGNKWILGYCFKTAKGLTAYEKASGLPFVVFRIRCFR